MAGNHRLLSHAVRPKAGDRVMFSQTLTCGALPMYYFSIEGFRRALKRLECCKKEYLSSYQQPAVQLIASKSFSIHFRYVHFNEALSDGKAQPIGEKCAYYIQCAVDCHGVLGQPRAKTAHDPIPAQSNY